MRISFKFHQNLKLNFKQILVFSLYNFSNFYHVIIYLEDLSKKISANKYFKTSLELFNVIFWCTLLAT